MTFILRRYKLLLVLLGLILATTVTWFAVSRQKSSKVPSRGVFVMQNFSEENVIGLGGIDINISNG